MRRNWPLWSAFSLCLAVVLAAMGWISVTALDLDEAETRARRQAALEENVRLALWRIDSALSPILAQESARPYIAYKTFVPPEQTVGQTVNRGTKIEEHCLLASFDGNRPTCSSISSLSRTAN